MTLELGRLFRVGQQITQVLGHPGGHRRTLHRVVVGVHADRVDVVTHGASDWGTDSFRLGEPVTGAFTIESLLPPRVGVLDRRPWPRTNRAFRYQVSLILESQALDGAWCTSLDSDSAPASGMHVFVPGWSAPIAHVRDLLAAYLPYERAAITLVPPRAGHLSNMIMIARTEESA